MLIVRDLTGGPRRFVELQRVLPGISTEQLRSRLNRMVADGLLTRQRYREVPPRVDYELTERARDLLPIVGALSRWGHRWVWGPPRPGERVDVGSILRASTGLPCDTAISGTLQVTVTDRGDADVLLATLTAHGGIVSYSERDRPPADATARGDRSAWVDALGPSGSPARLEISGDEPLARVLLEHLNGLPMGVAAVA